MHAPVSDPDESIQVRCRFSSGPMFYLEVILRMVKILRKCNFPSMTCVDTDTLLCGMYFRLTRKVKVILDAHEYFTEVPELKGKRGKKCVWRWVERWSIPKTSARYTVNDTLASHLTEVHKKEFKVVQNYPVLPPSISEWNPSHTFRMVYLGVLNQGRGLEELIEVIRDLPGVSLDLIGDGDISDDLQTLIDTLKLSDRVIFHGWQPPESLTGLLANKDLGVNILDPKSRSYRYSLANKFLDYVHAGIPVLTMAFPEYVKLMEEYNVGWLIDHLNKEHLSSMIDAIKSNPVAIAQKKEVCLLCRDRLQWKVEEPSLLSIYKSFFP